jgi:hypothetical protein
MDATQKVEATKQHQNETEIGYVEKPNWAPNYALNYSQYCKNRLFWASFGQVLKRPSCQSRQVDLDLSY